MSDTVPSFCAHCVADKKPHELVEVRLKSKRVWLCYPCKKTVNYDVARHDQKEQEKKSAGVSLRTRRN